MTRIDALIALKDAAEAGRFEMRLGLFRRAGLIEHGSLLMAAFDGSLDAARSLHEAVLPGYAAALVTCGFGPEDRGKPSVMVLPYRPENDHVDDSECHTESSDELARAWLIAVISALIAQEQEQ